MGPLAIVMFVGLFTFGKQVFGWHDGSGSVQLALFASFLFGIIASYRNNRM